MISITERKLIVKFHSKGKKQQEIADLIGCSQPTVNLWIHRNKFKNGLKTRSRSGRPTELKGKNIERLKKKILDRINSANATYNSVSTKQIKKLIHKEIGRSYSIRHVERIMHKLGFSLITPRPQHIRHDQKKVDQFRDEFKKNFNRSMWGMK